MYTFDDNTYSNLYKDCFGFRPSAEASMHWRSLTVDQKQAEWDRLCVALEEEIKAEKEVQDRAIARFEARVVDALNVGAPDRETAIRWLIDALNLGDDYVSDEGYVECQFGLPYGYLKNNR